MIGVTGIGWISSTAYGRVRTGVLEPLAPGTPRLPSKTDVFDQPFKNFGRLDHASRMVCSCVGLALRDSGHPVPLAPDVLAGIVGGGRFGCEDSDRLYFTDYVEGGRTLGRGNYFVYTLPTSPLAEASIHFGLRAAVMYIQDVHDAMGAVLETSAMLMEEEEATFMLAGVWEQDSACFAVLEKSSTVNDARMLCSLEEARNAARLVAGSEHSALHGVCE